jgi:hypothetical protein
MQEYYTDVLINSANSKPVCVSYDGNYAVASLSNLKFASYFPDQRGGDMKVAYFDANTNFSAWELDFKGTIYPYQMIIANGSLVVVGAFEDSIQVSGNTHLALDSLRAFGFIASISNGQLNWLRVLEDSVWNSMANSVCVLPSGNLLVSTLYHDVESSILKLNAQNGQVIASKIFPGIRTISSIQTNNNKVYFAGSTQDFAMIDSFQVINPMANGYVNYICLTDTNLNVNAVHNNPYITFDFSSKLFIHNGGVVWAHYSIGNSQSFIQNISYYNEADTLYFNHKLNTELIDLEYENRLISSKYYDGDLIVLKKINKQYYMFNISGGSINSVRVSHPANFTIYDLSSERGSFYFIGQFESDSLYYLNNVLLNPYANEGKTVAMVSYLANNNSGIVNNKGKYFRVYPNPVDDQLQLNFSNVLRTEVLDLAGKKLWEEKDVNTVNTSAFEKGMYVLKVFTSDGFYYAKFIKK